MRDVEVAGVGCTDFGKHLERSLGSLTKEAVERALKDAALESRHVEAVMFSNAAAGVMSGQEMIRGQVALKGTGLQGRPVINTENACASGSTAAHLAWLSVASGQVDVALAVGAEKLFHPDKARSFAAIESGTDLELPGPSGEVAGGSVMMGSYGAEARAYAAKYGDVTEALAAIAVKNRWFASRNPHAQFQAPISTEDVAASRLVADPLRLLTCSPLTDGAAAIVFRAAESTPATTTRSVRVGLSTMCSYEPGHSVVRRTVEQAYRRGGLGPSDIDVFQLHDACAFAELAQYEEVGIAAPGQGLNAILEGRTARGGDRPVNTDGGLLSRGHALGATGLAQMIELTYQLRGEAGPRQVPGARTGLAVNGGGWMGDDYAITVATLLVAH